jgi:IclR family acetate operon transcriptional repressor
VIYVDRVESQWPLGLRFEPGSKVPLHCTAIGKLLLAELPGSALEAHLASGELARYTSSTITDARKLRTELERTRQQGFSLDNEEFRSGVICMAVPVRGPRDGQVCAGLAISAAQARHTLAGVKRFLPDLRAAATRLERALAEDEAGATNARNPGPKSRSKRGGGK